MLETLNDIERRIFGVLLEKALAQPQYYPMTVNSVVAAANQKSNRDPVMDLDEDAAWATLEALRTRGLVARVLPGSSGRVERFKHEAQAVYGWEKPQRAIMTELLLRGPQTLSELRTRCARMYPFESTDMVAGVLANLSECDPPHVVTLPRAPGQSATRYAHCLYLAGELEQLAALPAGAPPAAAAPAASAAVASGVNVADLADEVAALRALCAELQQRVERLEGHAPDPSAT